MTDTTILRPAPIAVTVTRPDGSTGTYVNGPILIGRESAHAVTVVDPLVSRRHAQLEHDAIGWLVRDLGSSNGTWVDGRQVAELRLIPGRQHEVRIGSPTGPVVLVRTAGAEVPAPTPRPYDGNVTVPRTPGAALVVGRAAGCDVVVDDPLMSRRHFRVDLTRGTVTDLGSANGTYVQGEPVASATHLQVGAIITAGNTSFAYDGATLQPVSAEADLIVEDVVVAAGQRRLLDEVSIALPPRSLTAVIGPSGAGKSTLLSTLTGTRTPDAGRVIWQGRDLHANHASLRAQIGLVPQQDIQHDQLTVRTSLGFSAELRLPPDTTRAERDRRVAEVTDQLQLTKQLDLRIGKSLSGGQKKRVSIATELLTAPPLLFLDEPTSGLDPALDREVMEQLRSLADQGHTVLTVTHSVQALEICDRVLVLAPGGRVAYFGAPDGLLAYFGVTDYVGVFRRLAEGDVVTHRAATVFRPTEAAPAPRRQVPATRQFWTLARRTATVAAADRLFLGLLFAMPLMLGLLAHVVQGSHGFQIVLDPKVPPSSEYGQRLSILVIGSCLMGLALTIKELVGERPILLREYGVGESLAAYWMSKVAVFTVLGLLQGAVFVAIASIGVHGPRGGGVLGAGILEILIPVAACTAVMTTVGLTLSALVRTTEQTMPALVVMVMIQLVLSGTLLPVAGRPVLAQLSWLSPARWGTAGAASSMDYNVVRNATQLPDDLLFRHSATTWLVDLSVVIESGIVIALIGYLILRVTTVRRA